MMSEKRWYSSDELHFISGLVPALLAARIISNGYLEAGDYISALKEADAAWEVALGDLKGKGEVGGGL